MKKDTVGLLFFTVILLGVIVSATIVFCHLVTRNNRLVLPER